MKITEALMHNTDRFSIHLGRSANSCWIGPTQAEVSYPAVRRSGKLDVARWYAYLNKDIVSDGYK